jgi:hypothetical protein
MRPTPTAVGLASLAIGLGVASARNLVRLKQAGRLLEAAKQRLARQEALLDSLARARARGDTAAVGAIEAELQAATLAQDAALTRARSLLDLRVARPGDGRRTGPPPRRAPA